MLVIQRKAREGVRIGKSIYVVVLDVKQKRVKLGIEAPTDLEIARDELPPVDSMHAK